MARTTKKSETSSNEAVLARWNAPGLAGFEAWLADVKPRILLADNRYGEFTLEPWQRQILADALACGETGAFKHSLCVTRMPRRHSKSTLWGMVCLWLVTSRENLTISLLGNSELHSARTQFAPLKRVVAHTKALAAMIPPESITKFHLAVPHTSSVIQGGASSLNTAFGDRIGVLWCSDFHQCDTEIFDALQGSLLDSTNTLVLIDANADPEGGPVHLLEQQAATDPAIYCNAVEYLDFQDYCARAPAWIDRQKAKQLQRTQLDVAFQRDVLGKRSAARNALFPPETIQICRCEMPHPFPADKLRELTHGRKYVVGMGLDRSKRLFGGDGTVLTTTLKLSSESGEPEYHILHSQKIEPNAAVFIKRAITKDHAAYKIDNLVLENYEVTDLLPWIQEQKIPCESLSAHNKNQNLSFIELHRVAKEGRLHFSNSLVDLQSELSTFAYQELRDGMYSFGHSQQKFHDDRVYSLNWSVFATRANVLELYSLPRLVCANRTQRRSMCFLWGGDMELLCRHECEAFYNVDTMYRNFSRLRTDTDLTLPGFFSTYVHVNGPKVYQGV